MPSYLVETYLARGDAGGRAACERRARSVAAELTGRGTRVRFDRTIHLPADEICFFVFDAPSGRDAALAAQRAELAPIRVVEAVSSQEEELRGTKARDHPRPRKGNKMKRIHANGRFVIKHHIGVGVLVGLAALAALATAMLAGSASAGAPATAPVGAEIKSDYLTGFRPNGTPVDFTLKFTALGETTSSLTGAGRHTGSGGAVAEWSVTGGSVSGDIVTLSAVVTAINNPALHGSLGTVVGNASTGAITFFFGPLTGGPYAGQTIVGEGFGNVKIRQ